MFNLVVDAYLDYMETVEGIDRDDFWLSKALNKYTDKTMDDKFFVFTYADEVLDEQVLDATYIYLIDKDYPKDYPLEQLVPYLANRYYIHKFNEAKNEVSSSIENDSVQEIVKRFKTDYDYGMEIVQGYYDSFMQSNQYTINANQVNETDHSVMIKLSQAYLDLSIQTLNEKLRGVIVNLFNHYIDSGYSKDEALEMTWLYFTSDFDPLRELENMGVDIRTKFVYKKLMLGLIYGDLVEDFRKEEVDEMETEADRMIACLPTVVGSLGMVQVPNDQVARDALLERFIFLQDDEERVISNRHHTYDSGNVNLLKKLNPNYILDELKFMKKS